MYYRGKARVRPVVSQRKDTEFDVTMASFNLNLLTIPSALITRAPRVNQSRSMDDFRHLREDDKVVCSHYEKNILGVNLIKVFQNKRLSLKELDLLRWISKLIA